jgi:hypothetical protein
VKAVLEVTMDCRDAGRLADFWTEAVGYSYLPWPGEFASQGEWIESRVDPADDDGLRVRYLHDPEGGAPFLCLLEVPEPKTVKNRLHFDVNVAGDGNADEKWERITAERDRLVPIGATVVKEYDHDHITMGDPEGNEFDLC